MCALNVETKETNQNKIIKKTKISYKNKTKTKKLNIEKGIKTKSTNHKTNSKRGICTPKKKIELPISKTSQPPCNFCSIEKILVLNFVKKKQKKIK